MDLLFSGNERRQRQSEGPAMTTFILDAHSHIRALNDKVVKWLRRSQSRSKVTEGLWQSFCFLLWFRNLSDWFQNLPFVLLFRRFLNSIHILSEMERNLWSFLNRLSFYLILLNFFERIKEWHSTKQKKTMSRTRCKNPLFYAPNAWKKREKKRKNER